MLGEERLLAALEVGEHLRRQFLDLSEYPPLFAALCCELGPTHLVGGHVNGRLQPGDHLLVSATALGFRQIFPRLRCVPVEGIELLRLIAPHLAGPQRVNVAYAGGLDRGSASKILAGRPDLLKALAQQYELLPRAGRQSLPGDRRRRIIGLVHVAEVH